MISKQIKDEKEPNYPAILVKEDPTHLNGYRRNNSYFCQISLILFACVLLLAFGFYITSPNEDNMINTKKALTIKNHRPSKIFNVLNEIKKKNDKNTNHKIGVLIESHIFRNNKENIEHSINSNNSDKIIHKDNDTTSKGLNGNKINIYFLN